MALSTSAATVKNFPQLRSTTCLPCRSIFVVGKTTITKTDAVTPIEFEALSFLLSCPILSCRTVLSGLYFCGELLFRPPGDQKRTTTGRTGVL